MDGTPDNAAAVVDQAGLTRESAGDDGGHRGIAVLLALTAIAVAIVAAVSSGLSSQAGDAWQLALRQEAKRSAAAVTDIQFVYQTEVPQAVSVLSARLQEARLRDAATGATGSVAAALSTEADAQKGVAEAIAGSVALVADDRYLLPGGGRHLSERLADLRAEQPDLVAVDPDASMAHGDALAARASSITIALWPLALGATLGALAEPFRRQRRLLLLLGTASLGAGALVAVAAGVMA